MNTIEQVRQQVKACNKYLEDNVDTMSCTELLNNCHPIDRLPFAKQLHKEGLITEYDLKDYSLKIKNYENTGKSIS